MLSTESMENIISAKTDSTIGSLTETNVDPDNASLAQGNLAERNLTRGYIFETLDKIQTHHLEDNRTQDSPAVPLIFDLKTQSPHDIDPMDAFQEVQNKVVTYDCSWSVTNVNESPSLDRYSTHQDGNTSPNLEGRRYEAFLSPKGSCKLSSDTDYESSESVKLYPNSDCSDYELYNDSGIARDELHQDPNVCLTVFWGEIL